MDSYLTQYLQDNPNARQYLEQRLSTLCKSFQILPEAGKVVLTRGSALSGLPRCKWEMQVDDVNFHLQQKYHCYFEVDPAKVRTLLQKNPVKCSENLCIYKEQDLAVVVGEHDEVEKLIQSLDAPQVKPQIQRDCGISSMQFTLVEEDFGSQMKVSFPHISISIKGSGALAFEGPETEVEAACAKLQELIKRVRQKRLQLPAPLLSFLTSSGAMQSYKTRFQRSLRSPVMFEVAPDLVLSSLSTEALEEAATALERDVTMETVILDQAELPGMVMLKEVLSQALQQANHEAMKVELSYEQLSKSDVRMQVQIVGYRKEVDRLKDILLDYKLNQTDIHKFLSLPNAAMADHLYQVLELIGIQHGDLKLNITKSPSLGVDFSGPRQLVQEFHRTLTSTLRFLVCREYSLEGPGVRLYFSGEGKNAIDLLERSHKVLIFLSEEERHSVAASSQPTSPISIPNLTMTATTRPTPATSPPVPPVPRKVTPRVRRALHTTPNKIRLEVVMGHLEEQQVSYLFFFLFHFLKVIQSANDY